MNTFQTIITECCAELGIALEFFSFGWVCRLSKDGRVRHIVGRHMDVNRAAADRLVCDKYACYIALRDAGVSAVEHVLLFDPARRPGYGDDPFEQARGLLRTHGRVVVKPNNGLQGRDVSLCADETALRVALDAVFKREPTACVSPFVDYRHEYRAFCVSGDCPYAYGKKRAADGWKHNLSGGASAFEITDAYLAEDLASLARRAAAAAGIDFATVDIADGADGAAVLEINAGVAVTKLLEQLPHRRETAKGIYRAALAAMFGDDGHMAARL